MDSRGSCQRKDQPASSRLPRQRRSARMRGTMASRNDFATRFGDNLRRLRQQAVPRLSQEELGMRASLHRTAVGQLERGERVARADTVVKLAGAPSVSPEQLLDGLSWVPGSTVIGKMGVTLDAADQSVEPGDRVSTITNAASGSSAGKVLRKADQRRSTWNRASAAPTSAVASPTSMIRSWRRRARSSSCAVRYLTITVARSTRAISAFDSTAPDYLPIEVCVRRPR